MAILYTSEQVEKAQERAVIALVLISEKIQNGFYYFYSPIYNTYKDLQYDIYTLQNVIANENPYVTYNSTPTQYEYQFYELVGSMINKTKAFDAFGQYGGSQNPNYQSPGITVIVQNPVPYLSPMDIPWASFSTDNSPDSGVSRNTYYNTGLAGINPFMQDQTTTLLYNGIDYDLIPSGGFILKTGGNLPFIYDGQSLRAYAYQFIGSVPSPIAIRIPQIFEDGSGTPLDNTYLNATYPYPQYIEGDIITVASVNLQYQRQNNSNPSLWNEEPFNYAG